MTIHEEVVSSSKGIGGSCALSTEEIHISSLAMLIFNCQPVGSTRAMPSTVMNIVPQDRRSVPPSEPNHVLFACTLAAIVEDNNGEKFRHMHGLRIYVYSELERIKLLCNTK